ncbi:MAG: hypothetical protein V3U45_07070 [bacterium]
MGEVDQTGWIGRDVREDLGLGNQRVHLPQDDPRVVAWRLRFAPEQVSPKGASKRIAGLELPTPEEALAVADQARDHAAASDRPKKPKKSPRKAPKKKPAAK